MVAILLFAHPQGFLHPQFSATPAAPQVHVLPHPQTEVPLDGSGLASASADGDGEDGEDAESV